MMGNLNSFLARGGGNLNKNLSKNSNARGVAGGDVEASICLVHKLWFKQKREIRTKFRVFLQLGSELTMTIVSVSLRS